MTSSRPIGPVTNAVSLYPTAAAISCICAAPSEEASSTTPAGLPALRVVGERREAIDVRLTLAHCAHGPIVRHGDLRPTP